MKKALRKLLALVLALGMLAGAAAMAASEEPEAVDAPPERPFLFADVEESDWYYTAVTYLWDRELMNGITDRLFAPHEVFTRGMAATILHRLEGRPEAEPSEFADVRRGVWYTAAVDWASANGIIKGYPGETIMFHPEDAITRQEMAVILSRYASYKGLVKSTQVDMEQYRDLALVGKWALEDVAWAVGVGLMRGKDGSNLYPGQFTSRAEAAQMVMNFCEKLLADEAAETSAGESPATEVPAEHPEKTPSDE